LAKKKLNNLTPKQVMPQYTKSPMFMGVSACYGIAMSVNLKQLEAEPDNDRQNNARPSGSM